MYVIPPPHSHPKTANRHDINAILLAAVGIRAVATQYHQISLAKRTLLCRKPRSWGNSDPELEAILAQKLRNF